MARAVQVNKAARLTAGVNEGHGVFEATGIGAVHLGRRGGFGQVQHVAQFIREGLEIGSFAAARVFAAVKKFLDTQFFRPMPGFAPSTLHGVYLKRKRFAGLGHSIHIGLFPLPCDAVPMPPASDCGRAAGRGFQARGALRHGACSWGRCRGEVAGAWPASSASLARAWGASPKMRGCSSRVGLPCQRSLHHYSSGDNFEFSDTADRFIPSVTAPSACCACNCPTDARRHS